MLIDAEFCRVASVHALALVAPGPDLAVVIHQSVTGSRRHTLATILGIAAGVLFHVCWSLLGVGLLLNAPSVLTRVRTVSTIYLAGVGLLMIRASRRPASRDSRVDGRRGYRSFALGFVTNAMNPK